MRSLALLATALSLSGCSLIDSSGIHVEYSFDSQAFVIDLGDNGSNTVPSVPCQPMPDSCAQMTGPPVTNAMISFACDPTTHCQARLELRKALPIDLRNAMTPVPQEAVQFGISVVDLEKIDYWVVPPTNGKQQLNVATPPFELYVAPMSAKDEHDSQATLLGTVGPLAAGSTTCTDPVDTRPTSQVAPAKVCTVPLTGAGKDALGGFVKNFKNAPFQIIAHTVVTVAAGSPLPSGTLDFFVQPTVALSIIK